MQAIDAALPRHDRGLRRRQPQRHVGHQPVPDEGAQARLTTSPRRSPIISLPRPARIARSGSTARRSPKVAQGEEGEEPLYGCIYLPRKFKIVVAVPPDNDVDIFAHDLGFIAVVEKGELIGWNVTVGRRHGHDARRTRHVSAHRRHARLHRAGGRHSRRRSRDDDAARLGQSPTAQARAAEVHDRGSRHRRLQGGSREAVRQAVRQHTALHIQVIERRHRLAPGPRQEVAPHAVHRERPHQGCAGQDGEDGVSAARRAGLVRVRADVEPEPDPRQHLGQERSRRSRRS